MDTNNRRGWWPFGLPSGSELVISSLDWAEIIYHFERERIEWPEVLCHFDLRAIAAAREAGVKERAPSIRELAARWRFGQSRAKRIITEFEATTGKSVLQ